MKIFYTIILLLWVQIIQAQYTKLHDFVTDNNLRDPKGEMVSDGTWLYGMTTSGGAYNLGTIFKIKPDGTGLTYLNDFNGTNGSKPYGSLTLEGTKLYGVTRDGGFYNKGVLFRINTDGTGYSRLVNFDGTSYGSNPLCTLLYSGTALYGTTNTGGTNNSGVLFKMENDSTGFVKLLDFDGTTTTTHGSNPVRGLTIYGTTLYGTTNFGGTSNYGVIFKIETNGTGFSKLHDFAGSDGEYPWSSLVLSGTTLYGTTAFGGTYSNGVVFKIGTDGSGYTPILDFDNSTNGGLPYGLTISGNYLFGATFCGGMFNKGVVYKIYTPDGTYTKLLDFTGSNGEYPIGSVTSIGTKLFGVTDLGGTGIGTIFSINNDGTGYTKLLNCSNSPLGMYPGWSNFVSDGTWLYGTTGNGGLGYGTVYKMNPNGTNFTKLFDFDQTNGETPCNLILSGSMLYGTTSAGGTYGMGTIFSINTNGTGFTDLFDFDGTSTGSSPNIPTLIGSTIYGSTTTGGTSNLGVIFKININGTGYTKLLDFDGTNYGSKANSDLVLSGTMLYGTTINGGMNDMGVIFRINTNGTGFTKMVDFGGSNGSYPYSSLTLNGTVLYGMTYQGGLNDKGTIFRINTDGNSFTKIYDFDGVGHGSNPTGSLTFSGTKLFGITNSGGSNNMGVFFRTDADGSSFTKLLDFDGINNGRNSYATPFELNGTLYGQTNEGGTYNAGTIFKYDLEPEGAGTISGPSAVCAGQSGVTYSVPAIAYADTYLWSLPSGSTGSSSTNTISVSFGTGSVSGNISVQGSNSFGNGTLSTKVISVSSLPAAAGVITGPSTVVQGQNLVGYSVTAISNAVSYSWSYSGSGSTITGSGNSVTLSFSNSATSGNLTVGGTNNCGNGAISAVFPVTVTPKANPSPPAIGTITQPTCIISTGSVVLNGLPATGNWTITRNPGGITNSGTGTSLTIPGLESGTYTFTVTDASGNTSSESVAVIQSAETGIVPAIKTKWNDMLICYNLKDSISSYQWYKNNATITNATNQYYVTGKIPGAYKVETIDKEGCRNFSNIISFAGTKSISVYPNPASVSFALKINDEIEKGAVVSISNSAGVKVFELEVGNNSNESLKNIPVDNLDEGIYFVRILIDNKDLYYTKIVVVK